MTIAKQLALVLVKEITADKKSRHIEPTYALRKEVNTMVDRALDALVADGSLIQREASVNRHIAYTLPNPATTAISATSASEICTSAEL